MVRYQAGKSPRACMDADSFRFWHHSRLKNFFATRWLTSLHRPAWKLTWRQELGLRPRHPQRVGALLLHNNGVAEQDACAPAQPAADLALTSRCKNSSSR